VLQLWPLDPGEQEMRTKGLHLALDVPNDAHREDARCSRTLHDRER